MSNKYEKAEYDNKCLINRKKRIPNDTSIQGLLNKEKLVNILR